MPVQTSLRRWPFLDELRGLAFVMMFVYHFLYDGYTFAGWDIPLYSLPLFIWQNSIGALFILLSGCVCRFSRSNIKRGLRCFGAALLFTAVTYLLFGPSMTDWFGVLHFLGAAMLLYPLAKPLIERIEPLWGAASCAVLFALFFPAENGRLWIGFGALTLPRWLYQNFFTAILGFPPAGFVSSDYYPIIPWIFLFLAGGFLGKLLSLHGTGPQWFRSHCPPLAFLGRHSFFLYLIHQPVLYGGFLLAGLLGVPGF